MVNSSFLTKPTTVLNKKMMDTDERAEVCCLVFRDTFDCVSRKLLDQKLKVLVLDAKVRNWIADSEG